jgi:hypothetical protein
MARSGLWLPLLSVLSAVRQQSTGSNLDRDDTIRSSGLWLLSVRPAGCAPDRVDLPSSCGPGPGDVIGGKGVGGGGGSTRRLRRSDSDGARPAGRTGLGDVMGEVITAERACRLCNGKGFRGCARSLFLSLPLSSSLFLSSSLRRSPPLSSSLPYASFLTPPLSLSLPCPLSVSLPAPPPLSAPSYPLPPLSLPRSEGPRERDREGARG